MIALVAGFLLVAYLLAPGAIYRLTFSFYISSKRFQRTRTEEIVFSVLVTVIPSAWRLPGDSQLHRQARGLPLDSFLTPLR